MEIKADQPQTSLSWFEIWRVALLHPTVETFHRIADDPKASIKWGIIWMAITSSIIWFTNPLRSIFDGLVMDNFGLQSFSYFLALGVIISLIVSVIALMIAALVAHGFARLFGGEGKYQQLVYCWGVMLLPFVLVSGLVSHVPAIFPSSRTFAFSRVGMIVQIISIALFVGVSLYQLYAEVIAFAAIEKLGFWKSIGILLLTTIIVGIAIALLFLAFRFG